jgi:hypothetical protein
MPDLIAIGQGLSAAKALTDIAKTMVGLRDSAKLLETTVEFQQQLFSVQKSLLDAQAEQTTLIDRVRELEKEVADLKAWQGEKYKYEMTPLGRGIAYTLKPEEKGAEPPHYVCTQCYDDGKRSVLQNVNPGTPPVYKCNRCGNMLMT